MNTRLNRWMRTLMALTLILTLLVAVVPAQAASISGKKPKINALSNYSNGKVYLTYSKISGATGYEIYRSKTKNGSYSKFATSKSTTLAKSATGNYFYKVRAVKGKTKSKFSNPVEIFAANCNITNVTFDNINYLQARIMIRNKSQKAMNFLATNLGKFYLIDKKAQKVVGSTSARLVTSGGSIGVVVPANKSQAIWVQYWDYALWNTYLSDRSRYEFLVSFPFSPGSGNDPLKNFAIGAMAKVSDSSIACR